MDSAERVRKRVGCSLTPSSFEKRTTILFDPKRQTLERVKTSRSQECPDTVGLYQLPPHLYPCTVTQPYSVGCLHQSCMAYIHNPDSLMLKTWGHRGVFLCSRQVLQNKNLVVSTLQMTHISYLPSCVKDVVDDPIPVDAAGVVCFWCPLNLLPWLLAVSQSAPKKVTFSPSNYRL